MSRNPPVRGNPRLLLRLHAAEHADARRNRGQARARGRMERIDACPVPRVRLADRLICWLRRSADRHLASTPSLVRLRRRLALIDRVRGLLNLGRTRRSSRKRATLDTLGVRVADTGFAESAPEGGHRRPRCDVHRSAPLRCQRTPPRAGAAAAPTALRLEPAINAPTTPEARTRC